MFFLSQICTFYYPQCIRGRHEENHQTSVAFCSFYFLSLFIMDKQDISNTQSGKSIALRRKGKGLLHKRESAKEFAVRTKIKYASCMDPLLEGD